MFYALSGLSEDQETGFSAHDIVIDASRSPGKLIDKMNGFERGVLPGLRRALENIKAKYPASYQKDFAGKPGIDIIFAGVENDSLAMVVKRIGLEDFPQAGVVLQYPIENLTFDAVYIGQHDAILHFREKNPNWWQEGRRNLIKSARSLIEMQISETPLTVGPPVDTLSIELAGHRWTNLKPECREAKDK
jgi:hypothetical protein